MMTKVEIFKDGELIARVDGDDEEKALKKFAEVNMKHADNLGDSFVIEEDDYSFYYIYKGSRYFAEKLMVF